MDEESVTIRTKLPCPDCGSHDALAEYSDGHTYCFSCETYHKGNGEAEENKRPEVAANLIPLEEMELQALPKRCLTQATCRRYGYYVSSYDDKPCQVACYMDDNGKIIGQKLRFSGKEFKCLGKVSGRFFGQHLFNKANSLIITEGEIDCLSVSQIVNNKYAIVSLPNGCTSAKKVFSSNLEWLSGFKKIVLMFDMDEPGRKAIRDVVGLLQPGQVFIANLPLKDANECLQHNMAGAVLDGYYNAKAYKPDGIVNGAELWSDLIKEEQEAKQSYPLPWDIPLQQMSQGIRKGELIVVTAGTGIGKTTFVRQIAYHLGTACYCKIGMLMLEENIKRTAKGLMAVHLGKRITVDRELVTDEEYKQAFDEVLGSGNFVFYNHFGSLEAENLLSRIRYMIIAEQCDFIILDHITIAISGLDIENERKATDVLMTQLRSLVEETGAGMLIISHLKRVDGQSAEEGGAISLSHLRGSQSLAQLSDSVWALERNQQMEDEDMKNLVKIRILKNRATGETGIAGYLKYNKNTDRLESAVAPPRKEIFGDEETYF